MELKKKKKGNCPTSPLPASHCLLLISFDQLLIRVLAAAAEHHVGGDDIGTSEEYEDVSQDVIIVLILRC